VHLAIDEVGRALDHAASWQRVQGHALAAPTHEAAV